VRFVFKPVNKDITKYQIGKKGGKCVKKSDSQSLNPGYYSN